jgi:secreted trypsin-like serine protease
MSTMGRNSKRQLLIGLLAIALVVGLAPNAPAGAERSGTGAAPAQPHIVGGTVAADGEYPYQVALLFDPADPFNTQFCGGSVIHPLWILTAAHCSDFIVSPDDVFVLANTNDLVVGEGDAIPVQSITIHPSWNPATFDNDFALWRLERAANTSLVPLVRNPTQNALWAAGTPATTTGWGALTEGGAFPTDLREVTVPIVSDATCATGAYYGSDFHPSNMVCAGEAAGGKDSCQGDSGGPLVVDGPSGKPIQMGVVSWGDGCARANKPGIYSRVSLFESWIEGVVGKPTHDNISAARVPACTVTFDSTATAFSTEQASEPNHAGNIGGASVWYKFTPSVHADMYLNTLGSDGDTLLAVYTDSNGGTPNMGDLVLVEGNDDISGGEDRSALDFHAFLGTTYYIAVDNFATSATTGPDRGRVRLNISLDPFVGEGPQFPDISESHPFAEDIAVIADAGITSGFADCKFHAGDTVTRQSMAAFFYRLAGWEREYNPNPGFTDVTGAHPFYREIAWMADNGITTGNPDGSYGATAPVTRQAMAAFFYRLAGSPMGPNPSCSSPPFPDVPTSNPFCGEIQWMTDEGIAGGFSDGTFRPGASVTRQSMARFMNNYMSL